MPAVKKNRAHKTDVFNASLYRQVVQRQKICIYNREALVFVKTKICGLCPQSLDIQKNKYE